MLDPTVLVVLGLVTYWVAGLIGVDRVFSAPRLAALEWLGGRGVIGAMIGYLITCPVCLSPWVAAVVVAIMAQVVSIALPVLMWAAVAGFSAALYRMGR